MIEKELYYGRELFGAIKLYLPPNVLVNEHLKKNGLIVIRIRKKYEEQNIGITDLIEVGADAPIKAEDLKELCFRGVEEVDRIIKKLQDAKEKKHGK